jgi:hypothetical protein
MDQEIQGWAKENGMKEVKRSGYTVFPLDANYYLICVSEFEMIEEDKADLTDEKLEAMLN